MPLADDWIIESVTGLRRQDMRPFKDPQGNQFMAGRPLNVCHIASGDLWAGAEVQISTLLKELRKSAGLSLSAILLNEGRLSEDLGAAGIPVVVIDERKLSSWQIFKSIKSRIKSCSPDIVHTHRYKEHILGGLAAKVCGTCVVIQTVHGLEEKLEGWSRAKLWFYSALNACITGWTAGGIVGVSQEIEAVSRRRFPGSHTICIPNGIDLNQVRAAKRTTAKRDELGIPREATVIGAVGRLAPIKGIEYLLRAVQPLCREELLGPIRLCIVGDGPLRSQLEQLAEQLGIADGTFFLGNRSDVHQLMTSFDIYALPSIHEGIPIALLEAMALGRPVVASRVGGVPEVLRDGVDGRLVPAGDVQALGSAIRELMVSPDLRKSMAEAGMKRVSEQHSADRMASSTARFYADCVSRFSRRRGRNDRL